MTWRSIPEVADVQERLERLFPRESFDTALSNPLAAKALVALIYVDAVADDHTPTDQVPRFAAPRHGLWLSQQVIEDHLSPDERETWYRAARRSKAAVEALERSWGLTFRQWAGDNSREPLRDETFRSWKEHEAIRERLDIPKNSPNGHWVLTAPFADLFDPDLRDTAFEEAVDRWQGEHMSSGARIRADTHRRREQNAAGIEVRLPDGKVRSLEFGPSSKILKAVIEQWAPRRLEEPEVLALSEPGDKVPDRARLSTLGIILDAGSLLPDVLIVDVGPAEVVFWIVEVVATDGPITEERRRELRQWAADQRIDPDSCQFLTAFAGRNTPPARRRLKDLAVGTYAWYADEPDRELSWREITGND